MNIYKNFTQYFPEEGLDGVLYIQDDAGNDWYELQKEFEVETLKIAFSDSGLIIDARTDVSSLVPFGLSVAEIAPADVPAGFPGKGEYWLFDGKSIVKKTLTPAELAEKAEQQRQRLLAEANTSIADWRTELQLGTISDEDRASLIKWMAYIKALKAPDLSGVKDEDGYKSILWPEKPSA